MRRMLDYRERFRVRRIIYSKATAIILLGMFVLVAQATWGMYEKSKEARDRRDKAVTSQKAYEERNRELENNINRLSTDRGLEEEIRSRYMVAKDGENVIVVRDPDADASGTKTILVPVVENKGFWQTLTGAVGLSQ